MTLPGLALFYGGWSAQELLSVMAQCFFITAWSPFSGGPCGYSLAFQGRAAVPCLGDLISPFSTA